MSLWKRKNSALNSLSVEHPVDESSPSTEVCPTCHKTVLSGRFCSECGSTLARSMSPPEVSKPSEANNVNVSTPRERDWHDSNFNNYNQFGSMEATFTPTHDMTSNLTSLSNRRFSLDVIEQDHPLSLCTPEATLNSGASPYLNYSSSLLPKRGRASTISGLSYPSLLQTEDTAYDLDGFESSAEPLYRSSLPDLFNIDDSETKISVFSKQNSLPQSHLLSPSLSSHGFEHPSLLSGDEDKYSFSYSTRPVRSMSDINLNGHDSMDYNLNSYFGDLNYSTTTSNFPSYSPFNDDYNTLHLNHPNLSLQSSMESSQQSFCSPFIKGSMQFRQFSSAQDNGTSSSLSLLKPLARALSNEQPLFASVVNNQVNGHILGLNLNLNYNGVDASELKKLNEYHVFHTHIVEMACTQNGSKNLQTYLNSPCSTIVRSLVIDEMIKEIAPTGSKIICDTFGNYFYQILFKKSSAQQKEVLLRSLLLPYGIEGGSTIYEISVNKTGTFAFQNIIDFMSGNRDLGEIIMQSLEHSMINDKIENVILKLIQETKGTHIIQRVMKTFSSDQWMSIYTILLKNCNLIAMDRNGSMVLRLCYDLVPITKKEEIANDIIVHAKALAVDPVGNYVVQHVLSIPSEASVTEISTYHKLINKVLSQLSGHYVELSKQKYSSNVVEKSIVNSKILKNHTIFDELLSVNAIMQLLENHFGTYVLQKTLQSISKEELAQVDNVIRESRSMNNGYNNAIMSKWKQIINRIG